MKTLKPAAKKFPAKKASAKADRNLVRRQLNFFFVVDCSGSMTGDKMASLNYAIRSAIPAMRTAATDNADNDVLLRVISFSDSAHWMADSAVPVADFNWHDLAASGESAMGQSFEMLAKVLTLKKLPGRQIPPVIVLLSDGLPTDDVDAGLAALNAADYGKMAVRIAIAIGSDADMLTLQSFIGQTGIKPLQANNAETLVNRIRWATSAPVKAASLPASGSTKPLQQIADSVVGEHNDGGELVW